MEASDACPAIASPGAPASVSFVRHSAGLGTPCADQIAVDGDGNVVFRAKTALGGGGYWKSELDGFRPDGGPVAPLDETSELVVAGAHGFMSYVAPSRFTWVDGGWALHAAELAWPVTLPGNLMWPAWYAGTLAVGPGLGGELLVVLAGADVSGDVEVDVARAAAGPAFPAQPFRAFAAPSPAPGWTTDRYAHALRTAVGGVAVGADGAGRILVVWDGTAACGPGTIAGRWFTPDGAPLGPQFLAAAGVATPDPNVQPRTLRLFRLQDGSLALRADDGTFLRRFAGGAPAGGPVPSWLAVRAGEDLAPLPHAGVVAALRGSSGGSASRVDVVAAGGQVCRRVAVPAPVVDPQAVAAGAAAPVVGVDGTIVALDAVTSIPETPGSTCTYRVWRRALR